MIKKDSKKIKMTENDQNDQKTIKMAKTDQNDQQNVEKWLDDKKGQNDQTFEKGLKLPIGTLEPVEKWQSCRLRVRIGRCPNISVRWFDEDFLFGVGFFAESLMSISLTNHFKGLVSTMGEVGVDWMAVKRSIREPKP